MMWVYHCLDIAGTLVELFLLYTSMQIFCHCDKKFIVKLIPIVLYTVLIYYWTWFIDDKLFKIPCAFLLLCVMHKLIYRVEWRNIITGVCCFYAIMISAESIAMLMASSWLSSLSVVIEGKSFMRVEVYIIYMTTNIVLTLLIRYFFKKFDYLIDRQSIKVILVLFLMTTILPVIESVSFLNGKMDWYNETAKPIALSMTFCMMIFFMYLKKYYYFREKEKSDQMVIERLQQQYAYYQDKQKDEERIRSIYHDMKNHLLVLEGSHETEAARKMAQELRTQIADYEDYICTGNDLLDVIIKYKAEECREKRITFSVAIDFSEIDFIEPLDISTLFGNGIDNAIEASEKLPEEDRTILVKAGKVHDFVSILIENHCLQDNLQNNSRTTKEDDFVHGFGISNMKKAAEKYGGACTTTQKSGIFTLKILIPFKNI